MPRRRALSYTVSNAPKGPKVRVTAKFTSTAGVGQKSWTQPIDQDSINKISGTFTWRTEFFGSIFEAAGDATFERWTPAIFGGADGGYKLVSGLYTFTASGKASQLATNLCSMKGSGQFALAKGNEFAVFNFTSPGSPPYEYTFGVASEGLPMIDIETYNCSEPAKKEFEGKHFEYPAVFGLSTPGPYISQDGITYADSFEHEEAGGKYIATWNFEGKP
jgi:hypothetical protein